MLLCGELRGSLRLNYPVNSYLVCDLADVSPYNKLLALTRGMAAVAAIQHSQDAEDVFLGKEEIRLLSDYLSILVTTSYFRNRLVLVVSLVLHTAFKLKCKPTQLSQKWCFYFKIWKNNTKSFWVGQDHTWF